MGSEVSLTAETFRKRSKRIMAQKHPELELTNSGHMYLGIRSQFRTRKIYGIHFVLHWQLWYYLKSSFLLMQHQF